MLSCGHAREGSPRASSFEQHQQRKGKRGKTRGPGGKSWPKGRLSEREVKSQSSRAFRSKPRARIDCDRPPGVRRGGERASERARERESERARERESPRSRRGACVFGGGEGATATDSAEFPHAHRNRGGRGEGPRNLGARRAAPNRGATRTATSYPRGRSRIERTARGFGGPATAEAAARAVAGAPKRAWEAIVVARSRATAPSPSRTIPNLTLSLSLSFLGFVSRSTRVERGGGRGRRFRRIDRRRW